MSLLDGFNRFFYGLYEAFRGPATSYCRLETADDPHTLVADDGSLVSVIDLEGTLTRISPGEYSRIIDGLTVKTQALFDRPGHTVQVIFEYNPLIARDLVRRNFEPSRVTAKNLGLGIDAVLSDWEESVASYCSGERCWLVVWSSIQLLSAIDAKKAVKESMAELKKMPLVGGVQKVSGAIKAIRHLHGGAVEVFLEAFKSLGIIARLENAHKVLKDLRSCVDPHFTSPDWSPLLPGDPLPVRLPDAGKHPLHHVLYPALPGQMFPREATIENRNMVQIGDQIHAPVFMSLPPQHPLPFNEFFKMMARKDTRDRIPMRMSMTLKPDGLGLLGFKGILAQILSFTSSENKKFVEAVDNLRELAVSGHGIVQFSMCFSTWVDVTRYAGGKEEAVQALQQQMAELTNMVQSWGTCDVQDVTGDPLLGVVACMPAMMPTSPAPKAAAPLESAWSFMPLRPASPWERGSMLLRTPEGKIMPFAPNSSEQTAWIDLTFAPMGAGKSVFLNVFNFAFMLQAGLTRFPWISIVDVGPSSAGLIHLIKAGLPPEKQHLAAYQRLKMIPEHSVNPFDTPLGCRKPLPSQASFLVNLLCLFATPIGESALPSGVSGIAQMAIGSAYDELEKNGNPFSETQDRVLAELLKAEGMNIDRATTWWEVTDFLFERGFIHEAHLAQRYAVPRLHDIVNRVHNDEGIKEIYGFDAPTGESILEYFSRCMVEAAKAYPILTLPTQFSLGDAQIVSLDLDEVAPKGGGAASRQSAVMYMLARHIVASRFFLMPSDVPLMPKRYREYHEKLISEIRQDPKRLCYDEAHRMASDAAASAQIVSDLTTSARESRKWNLSIGLVSQSFQDFAKIITELATKITILGTGTDADREELVKTFGFNSTIAYTLGNLGKPGRRGANMIVSDKVSTGTTQQAVTLTIGGLALWAFSSTTEDTTVRNRLYEAVGVTRTLTYLAHKYPGGIKAEVERRKLNRREGGIDEEVLDVLEELHKESLEEIELLDEKAFVRHTA